MIPPGDVYVLCHPSADQAILSECDENHYYLSNGDDGRCLAKGTETNHELIDCIGDYGADPGAGWDVCGVSGATKDATLIRKSGANAAPLYAGKTSTEIWDTSRGTSATDCQWIVEAQNYFADIGQHTYVPPPTLAPTAAPSYPPTPKPTPAPTYVPTPPVVEVPVVVVQSSMALTGISAAQFNTPAATAAFATNIEDSLTIDATVTNVVATDSTGRRFKRRRELLQSGVDVSYDLQVAIPDDGTCERLTL